jgi:hypothetical protein
MAAPVDARASSARSRELVLHKGDMNPSIPVQYEPNSRALLLIETLLSQRAYRLRNASRMANIAAAAGADGTLTTHGLIMPHLRRFADRRRGFNASE